MKKKLVDRKAASRPIHIWKMVPKLRKIKPSSEGRGRRNR